MPDERSVRAAPHGVIVRFAATSPLARSAEATSVAWRFRPHDGALTPADAAAVVRSAGAGRRRRWPHRQPRQLLERTGDGRPHPANDHHDPLEA
jgi:hypothetical protein